MSRSQVKVEEFNKGAAYGLRELFWFGGFAYLGSKGPSGT